MIRVIYNIEEKVIIDVVPAERTATFTQHQIIQDTAENCKSALQALGIDTSLIDTYVSGLSA